MSVTITLDNLLWLRARAQATRRSLSAALDEVLTQARRRIGPPRSVLWTIRVPTGLAGLRRRAKEIREIFDNALDRDPVLTRDVPLVR